MGVFSSIQNVKFFMGWVRAFWLFGFFFGQFKMEMDTFLPKILYGV
jgi:hypothetical protein